MPKMYEKIRDIFRFIDNANAKLILVVLIYLKFCLMSIKSHNIGVKDSKYTIKYEPNYNARLNLCRKAADGIG